MKKSRIMFLLLCLVLLIGCGNKESVVTENNESVIVNNDEEMDAEADEEGSEAEEEAIEVPGELRFSETVSLEAVLDVDVEKVNTAVELGYPSPETELDVYYYVSKEDDVIQYTPMVNVYGLESNFEHRGFESLQVVYEKTEYMWDDFFDELDVSEYYRNLDVVLKGDSIFEEEIEDEYAKYYRYYSEDKGVYYEVQDLMIGNFLEEDAELVNEKYGQACNYGAFNELVPPTHNPLVLRSGEEEVAVLITELDEKPCLYYETLYNDSLYKRWVSLEEGVIIKELVFSNEGLITSKKEAISIMHDEVDDQVFQEPKDVEYTDISMWIYAFEGGDIETLGDAVMNLLPESETGIVLTDEDEETITLYAAEIDEGMVDDVVYYAEYTLESGETRAVRYIQADRFYTVCDELEIVEIYDRSSQEKFFFDFESVGLLSVLTEGTSMRYAFYNQNNISVSGLYDVYEYVIEDGVLVNIVTYRIESIEYLEAMGPVHTYEVSFIDFDESMYDESCMDTYEIIDHGEGSIDDGEHMPIWYQ